jgi:hypothetical protein
MHTAERDLMPAGSAPQSQNDHSPNFHRYIGSCIGFGLDVTVADVSMAEAVGGGAVAFCKGGGVGAASETISERQTLLMRSRKFFVVCSSLDVVLRLGSDSHTL